MLRNYTAYFVVECSGYDNDAYTDAGFYPADSFSEAVKYLEDFYGSELVVIKHLELLDTSLMTMKPEVAAEIVANIFS
jgi:hypothetical protein